MDAYERDREANAVGQGGDDYWPEEWLDEAGEVEPQLCDECDHEVSLHDAKYGCQFERGDAPGDGEHCSVARGPCGCTAVTAEIEFPAQAS